MSERTSRSEEKKALGEVKRQLVNAFIRSLTVTVAPHPEHRGRYIRTYGPTVFQDWLPWGESLLPEW